MARKNKEQTIPHRSLPAGALYEVRSVVIPASTIALRSQFSRPHDISRYHSPLDNLASSESESSEDESTEIEDLKAVVNKRVSESGKVQYQIVYKNNNHLMWISPHNLRPKHWDQVEAFENNRFRERFRHS